MTLKWITTIIGTLTWTLTSVAGVSKKLETPPETKPLTGKQLAEQVYFVNHYMALSQMPLEYQPRGMNIIVNKTPKGKISTQVAERYVNTTAQDGVVMNRELVFFRYGKDKGMAMYNTDYLDDDRSKQYRVWVPNLRKVRRFAPPHVESSWGGTVLSYDDVTLRRVDDETHEIIGEQSFDHPLGMLQLPANNNPWLQQIPPASKDHMGKAVYLLKSTPKKKTSAYDYRVSYVDKNTFSDYTTLFYKDGEIVKLIDRDWQVMGMPDVRAQFWKYWYAYDFTDDSESLILFSPQGVQFESQMKAEKFWSELTITKSKR